MEFVNHRDAHLYSLSFKLFKLRLNSIIVPGRPKWHIKLRERVFDQGEKGILVLKRGDVNAANLSTAKQIRGRIYRPEKQRDNELKRAGISLSKNSLNC